MARKIIDDFVAPEVRLATTPYIILQHLGAVEDKVEEFEKVSLYKEKSSNPCNIIDYLIDMYDSGKYDSTNKVESVTINGVTYQSNNTKIIAIIKCLISASVSLSESFAEVLVEVANRIASYTEELIAVDLTYVEDNKFKSIIWEEIVDWLCPILNSCHIKYAVNIVEESRPKRKSKSSKKSFEEFAEEVSK